jgi:bacterioferritin
VGKTLREMIKQDIKDEAGAIELYKKIIMHAEKEGDQTTKLLFMEILSDEEDHHDTFTTIAEEM